MIQDNAELRDRLSKYAMPTRQYFGTVSADGKTILSGYAIVPAGSKFSTSQPCATGASSPVLLHTYGGPGSQSATQAWVLDWHTYLASKLGVVTVTVDNRGTGGRGQNFRTSVYNKLGDLESQDQAQVARNLKGMCNADTSRVMFWGWSYGGFMTLRTLQTDFPWLGGIAVAPVTVCVML